MSTIFALATPAGKSGVAIFRISGEKTCNILVSLGISKALAPRRASLCKLKNLDSNEVIDEAIVIWFAAPNSYTGEDVAELHIHGSRAVISELTEYLSAMDEVRLAEPGEFSRRAFDNGKMDLTMLEGVADLIDAQTKMQKKQALRLMDGELEQLYDGWRSSLISILANIEAYIDFPDEDIPQNIQEKMLKQADDLIAMFESHLADNRGERIREGFYVAILGAPNVGKSSLINALAKREVAIVSDIAGTTRDVVEVHLDVSGFSVTFADTAGLRESSNEIEVLGVIKAKDRAECADIRLCMFSADRLDDLDEATLGLIDDDCVIVINKCDEFAVSAGHKIKNKEVVCISAIKNSGVTKLLQIIESKITGSGASDDPLFTRQRHKNEIRNAAEGLGRFSQAFRVGLGVELCAEEIRVAAGHLGKITGKIYIEEIFDEIFSSFCIGK